MNKRVRSALCVLAAALLMTAGCDSTGDAEAAAVLLDEGLQAHQEGDLRVAESKYREVLVRDPNNAFAYFNLGVIAQGKDDLPVAETNYRLAIRTDPGFTSALFNLATVRTAQGDPAEAERLYEEVIHIDPDNAAAHLNLGFLLRDRGRSSEAEKSFARAVEIDSTLKSRITDDAAPVPEEAPRSGWSSAPYTDRRRSTEAAERARLESA